MKTPNRQIHSLTDPTMLDGNRKRYSIAASRLTIRNILGLFRYIRLWLRYPAVRERMFFVDRGADIIVGRNAWLSMGQGVRFMRNATCHVWGTLDIGDGVFFNRGCTLVAQQSVTIGSCCLFGEYVSIHDANHVAGQGSEPIANRGFVTKPIVIGHNVWIGAKATILPGVYIGDNAVIGANAVVTRDIPANSVAVGIPAHVIRELSESGG